MHLIRSILYWFVALALWLTFVRIVVLSILEDHALTADIVNSYLWLVALVIALYAVQPSGALAGK